MHLTVTIAIIVIAILVVAAYFYVTKSPPAPYVAPPSGEGGTSINADAAALDVLDQELNSATANISTSDIESAIASQ
jgi:hypothetical protein